MGTADHYWFGFVKRATTAVASSASSYTPMMTIVMMITALSLFLGWWGLLVGCRKLGLKRKMTLRFQMGKMRMIFNSAINKEKSSSEEKIDGKVPEGSLGWPLIGETLDFIACGYTSRPVSFMEKRKSLYGGVFKTHLLGKPVIVSTDPEVNKTVLLNHGNIFTPSYPKSITDLFGETSILKMDGAIHRRVHACIGRFLKSPILKARITRDIERSVKLSLDRWNHTKCLIYIQEETREITFEILVKVLMSLGPGKDMDFLKREYREFIKGLVCLPIKFPGTQLYRSLKAKERLLEMTRRIVEERKLCTLKELQSSSSNDDDDDVDAIDVLLAESRAASSSINASADHENISIRQQQPRQQLLLPLDFISGNIIEMMIPGEESVPMIMTLAVKFLGDNPVALTRLLEENMELKKKKIGSSTSTAASGNYDWTDYMSLTFTQNVISETLRMANIINAVWRQANQNVQIKEYLIPKGWVVLASFTSVHMDQHNYDNPYAFNPWRWELKKGGVGGGSSSSNNSSVTSSNNNSTTTFTPFGGGQRLCPGAELARLEISIFLHHFITTYRWEAEEDEIVHFPTVKMKRKLPITVTPLGDDDNCNKL